MNDFRQCFLCNWDYISLHPNTKLEEYEGKYYCPECNPMNNQDPLDQRISLGRKDLGRVLYMLNENPTPEELEIEILRERESILGMSTEELEQHIDELDKLYTALQVEAKKVKTKSIAALEVRRGKGDAKKERKEKKEKDVDTSLDDMFQQVLKAKVSSIKKSEDSLIKTGSEPENQ